MLPIFISMLESEEEKDKMTLIYEKYYNTMMIVAKSIVSDYALAEDAVSEAIITIINNLHKINDISCHKTRAYIAIIVRSRALNILKKQKNHPEEPIEDYKFSDNYIATLDDLTMKESCESIMKHINELSKTLSDVLYLSVVLEHSITEIANILNISNDVVRQRLSRAKSQIKKIFIQEGIEYAEK